MKLTDTQRALLTHLTAEAQEWQEWHPCERVTKRQTADALKRRGLVEIDDGDGQFYPWFDCRVTDAGRAALGSTYPNKEA